MLSMTILLSQLEIKVPKIDVSKFIPLLTHYLKLSGTLVPFGGGYRALASSIEFETTVQKVL